MVYTIEEVGESLRSRSRLCGAGPESLHRLNQKARTNHHCKPMLMLRRCEWLYVAAMQALIQKVSYLMPVLRILEASVVSDRY